MSKLMHEPCGCTHDGGAWLRLCPDHRAEADALHARAKHDHETVWQQVDALRLTVTDELLR